MARGCDADWQTERVIRLLLFVALGGSVWWFVHRARQAAAGVRATARRGQRLPRVPSALRGGGAGWVLFTSAGSEACRVAETVVAERRPADRVVVVDARLDPELASRWNVERVPTVLAVDKSGRVTARLVGVEALRRHLSDLPSDSEPLEG